MTDSIKDQLLKMGLVSREEAKRADDRRAGGRPKRTRFRHGKGHDPIPLETRRQARPKFVDLMNQCTQSPHQGQRSRFYVECVDGRLTYVLLDDANRQSLLAGNSAIVEPLDGPIGLVPWKVAQKVYRLDPSAILYAAGQLTTEG